MSSNNTEVREGDVIKVEKQRSRKKNAMEYTVHLMTVCKGGSGMIHHAPQKSPSETGRSYTCWKLSWTGHLIHWLH